MYYVIIDIDLIIFFFSDAIIKRFGIELFNETAPKVRRLKNARIFTLSNGTRQSSFIF